MFRRPGGFYSMESHLPNLDKIHVIHTDTFVGDFHDFTKISRWSKVVWILAYASFQVRKSTSCFWLGGELRWCRRQVWGHQLEILATLARWPQLGHKVIHKWCKSEMVQVPPEIWMPKAVLCSTTHCQACCSALKHVNIHVYEMGRWRVLWRGLPMFPCPWIFGHWKPWQNSSTWEMIIISDPFSVDPMILGIPNYPNIWDIPHKHSFRNMTRMNSHDLVSNVYRFRYVWMLFFPDVSGF